MRCLSPDRIFVSFPTVNRVIVLQNEGEYLYDVGCERSGDRHFSHPTGLAFDKFNHLIVCITENRRQQIFTLGEKYVAKLGGSSFKGSRLAFIASGETGQLLVTDAEKHCTEVRENRLGKDLLQLTLLIFWPVLALKVGKKT